MAALRTLKGRTMFISGGSRGIGLAIAIRAAQDGANVVIAAKTTEPHPKLPGTIHSAVAEINAGTATTICQYGGAFTTSAGLVMRFSAWLETNGQAVVLASGDCTIDIRENAAASDLFSVSSSSPTAQGIFEFEQLAPGFTSDRLYIVTVTIDDGVNPPWITRHDVPVFG